MAEETLIDKAIKLFCVNLLVDYGYSISVSKAYLNDVPFNFPPKKIEKN